MSALLQVLLVVAALAFLALVVRMVKRESTLLKYSLVWLFLGVVGLVAALFPSWVFAVSDMLGFEKPVNFIFFACALFLMIVSLGHNVIVSKQAVRIKVLTQELSLSNERIRRLEEVSGVAVEASRAADVKGDDRRGVPAGRVDDVS